MVAYRFSDNRRFSIIANRRDEIRWAMQRAEARGFICQHFEFDQPGALACFLSSANIFTGPVIITNVESGES